MDELILRVFSEQGLFALLFFLTFLGFLFRGIPYAVKKFDTVIQTFNETQKAQQALFERSLNQLISSFMAEGKSNSEWHREHSVKLNEIQKQLEKNNEQLEENKKQLEGCKFVQSAKIRTLKEAK